MIVPAHFAEVATRLSFRHGVSTRPRPTADIPLIATPSIPIVGCPCRCCYWLPGSAEGEDEELGTGIEELDLERPVDNGLFLPDELIEPLLGERPVAILVDVDSAVSRRRLDVDAHAKPHGTAWQS